MPITGHEGTKTPNEIWDNELERQQMENMIELVIAAHFAKSSAALGAITIFYDPGIAGPKAITDWICDHSFGRLVSKKQMKEGRLRLRLLLGTGYRHQPWYVCAQRVL